ncbi:MAG: serine/threonine-protein kinase [Acidobacteriota bacterium]
MKQCFKCNRSFEENSTFCPFDGQKLIFIQTENDLIGRLIDNKYQIEELIAKGGAGSVYRALHIQLNIPVAMKVMHNRSTSDVAAIERFRREAYAAMQIRHPNAIAVMDFGVTADKLVYVVMEYLQGVNLRQRLKQKRYFSAEEANEIIQQICAAVAVAHKRKIVHRDLKPENIFLHLDTETEVVKVLDFGIAKFKDAIHYEGDGNITRQGYVVGTPHYMSPEQCYGKEIDGRADVYSLGIILYEMLTGRMPFVGPSHTAIAVKQATEKARPTYEVRKGIPAVVNAVVMHALEKNPNNRPSDTIAFAAELEAAVKAVTEQEFLKVFLNASEQDLEAALLLASDPAKSRSAELESDLPTLEERLNLPNLPSAVAAVSAAETTTSIPTVMEPKTGQSICSTDTSISINLQSAIGTRSVSINRESLLNCSKETSMLLQIIIGDLETENPLDEIFLNELKTAVENLRTMLLNISSPP